MNMTADFGYKLPKPGAIGDYVWEDVNGDGIQDVTEEGIGNVTLRLWQDVNGDGVIQPITDQLSATTTTDADGGYIFPNLPPGKYIVEVTDANGILTGAAMTPTSGPQSRLSPYPVTLLAGEIERDVDFGYRTPADSGPRQRGRHRVVGSEPERRARSGRGGHPRRHGPTQERWARWAVLHAR